MRLTAGEPACGPFQPVAAAAVLADLLPATPVGRPWVIAVDGRSGGGKSTVAEALATAVPAARGPVAVVHTDDVAWWHSFFGWSELMRTGVLEPVRAGRLPVAYRPPAWEERDRAGAVEVGPGTAVVVVEGVGAGRRDLADLVDVLVWVQSDPDVARTRGIARDGGGEAAAAFWDEWDAQEVPFQDAERAWERARVVVLGTPDTPAGPGALWVAGPRDSTRSSPA